jgi:hypothetical protein
MNERMGEDGAWEIHTLALEGKLGIVFPLHGGVMTGYRVSDDPTIYDPPRYALTSDQVHALISDLNRALLDLERERDRQADEMRQGQMPF